MTPDEMRAALARLGITQRELARRVGCTEFTISRLLNGHRPPSPVIRRLIRQELEPAQPPATAANMHPH